MVRTYGLGDRLTAVDCKLVGVSDSVRFSISDRIDKDTSVRAVATDDYRVPYAGDWYLSGAIPCAYRAYQKLGNPYRIARLVKVRRVIQEIIL